VRSSVTSSTLEPGIGKSRLTAALSEHIESEPHIRLRYFCSPHHQDSPLHPFIVQLERAAGFARDDGFLDRRSINSYRGKGEGGHKSDETTPCALRKKILLVLAQIGQSCAR
jgi:predicted ATPase